MATHKHKEANKTQLVPVTTFNTIYTTLCVIIRAQQLALLAHSQSIQFHFALYTTRRTQRSQPDNANFSHIKAIYSTLSAQPAYGYILGVVLLQEWRSPFVDDRPKPLSELFRSLSLSESLLESARCQTTSERWAGQTFSGDFVPGMCPCQLVIVIKKQNS